MATIPLAKPYSEKHLTFPVFLSRKYDGVPIRIDIHSEGRWEVHSRAGKGVPSVSNLVGQFVQKLRKALPLQDLTLVGEVIQRDNVDADFKDTGGIIRKQTDQSEKLELFLFDCSGDSGFENRYEWMHYNLMYLHPQVAVVYQQRCFNLVDMLDHYEAFTTVFPQAEGMVVRNHDDPWCPGKRSWGYQKLLKEPTIDLRIVDMKEAVNKYGYYMGMVGGLVADYKGNLIGIGPGKLSHNDRCSLWYNYKRNKLVSPDTPYPNIVAKIKYKKDDSYDMLRQPTFQCWADKDTTDA